MPSKKGRARHRQHVYRGPKDRPGRKMTASHHCPECGKWCYRTRDDAEAAVGMLHPGATMHYYKCAGWWHYTSMTAQQVTWLKDYEAGEDEDYGDGEPEETVA